MSPRESNPDRLSLRVEGDGAVAEAVNATRSFGEALKLADGDLARLCIVVEELIANLYDHGGLTQQDAVMLALSRDPGGIRVSITDGGAAFNPWLAPAVASRRGGGAGIKLVQAWAQLIDYRSTDEGNQLELLVALGEERPATD